MHHPGLLLIQTCPWDHAKGMRTAQPHNATVGVVRYDYTHLAQRAGQLVPEAALSSATEASGGCAGAATVNWINEYAAQHNGTSLDTAPDCGEALRVPNTGNNRMAD